MSLYSTTVTLSTALVARVLTGDGHGARAVSAQQHEQQQHGGQRRQRRHRARRHQRAVVVAAPTAAAANTAPHRRRLYRVCKHGSFVVRVGANTIGGTFIISYWNFFALVNSQNAFLSSATQHAMQERSEK